MNDFVFSAQELICLANLCQKQFIYGIPNSFSEMDAPQRSSEIQKTLDRLMQRNIAALGFDGHWHIPEEYQEIIEVCCSCRKCLTVNMERPDGTSSDLIFWDYNGKIYLSDIKDDQYPIQQISPELAGAYYLNSWRRKQQDTPPAACSAVSIPLLKLQKARSETDHGRCEEAQQILQQNGADLHTAEILVDGFAGHADYLNLLLMDLSSGSCQNEETAFIRSRGTILTPHRDIVSSRTCLRFEPVSEETVHNSVSGLWTKFTAAAEG